MRYIAVTLSPTFHFRNKILNNGKPLTINDIDGYFEKKKRGLLKLMKSKAGK